MARTRRTSSKKTQTNMPAAAGSGELVCPECGKVFTRPASLGAHRNRLHGVVGANAHRRSRRPKSTPSPASASRPAPRRSTPSPNSAPINRDALLQTLFPNGVPPRESVIRNVNAWLDEAERLARTH
jgi:uncharacterized C2H2 Zn-finger protein